jgi:hypothetical protein
MKTEIPPHHPRHPGHHPGRPVQNDAGPSGSGCQDPDDDRIVFAALLYAGAAG